MNLESSKKLTIEDFTLKEEKIVDEGVFEQEVFKYFIIIRP
jgi:hypothetical protein